MSFRLDFNSQLTARETLTVGVGDVQSPIVRHDAFNRAFQVKDTDTPAASIDSSQSLTGTQTLDLTALATAKGTTDCTGKKLRALQLKNRSTNTGKLTIGPGVSNPYPLFGTGITVDVQLDGHLLLWFGDGLAAVAAGVKTITITPNNGADVFDIQLILG